MSFSERNPSGSLRRLRSTHVVWATDQGARAKQKLGALDENDLVIVLEPQVKQIGLVHVLTKIGVGYVMLHNFFDP